MKIRHPEKVNNPISPIRKKPTWIRTKILDTQNYFSTKEIINRKKLHTVCQEASCPNISECWSKKHATFMIMGDTCTRACAFCNVKTGKPGFPVFTSQKAHALVHVSPIIINVACFLLQHSVMFGQFASWQTVTRLFLLTTCLV